MNGCFVSMEVCVCACVCDTFFHMFLFCNKYAEMFWILKEIPSATFYTNVQLALITNYDAQHNT